MAYVNVFKFYYFYNNCLKHLRAEIITKTAMKKIIRNAKEIFAGYKN